MTKSMAIAVGVLAALLVGAPVQGAGASDKDEGATRAVQGRNDIEGEIIGVAAKGSRFAKLEIGMTQDEVTDLIGSGKQCGAYQTGKAWIPFRFSSSDTMRSECNYAGAGSLIYTQNKRGSYLLKIVNDASEDGLRD